MTGKTPIGKAKIYKYLGLITELNIVVLLITGVTGGKIVQLFMFPVSVAVLYYPITYIFGDVLTEVYGYAQARTLMWKLLIFSGLAAIVYQIVVKLPPAAGFIGNEAYTLVLGQVPRIVTGGLIALFTGQFLNDLTLAKIKLATKGKYLWIRTIASTVVGQLADAILFYTIAMVGVIPNQLLVVTILSSWFLKVLIEVLLTPFTYYVTSTLKRVENEDYFDVDTNFSPLPMKVSNK